MCITLISFVRFLLDLGYRCLGGFLGCVGCLLAALLCWSKVSM
ncbi:hypothetical protein ACFLV0_07640 [Chloroflexota bacterium]